jgi:hypothetical protein
MREIYELSDGTVQEVINGTIISHNSFEDLDEVDKLTAEYFQIEGIYPEFYPNYFEGKDLIVFKNGRKELVDDIAKTFYHNKCEKIGNFKNWYYREQMVLELITFTDGTQDWMCGVEANTISAFKIEHREVLFD